MSLYVHCLMDVLAIAAIAGDRSAGLAGHQNAPLQLESGGSGGAADAAAIPDEFRAIVDLAQAPAMKRKPEHMTWEQLALARASKKNKQADQL